MAATATKKKEKDVTISDKLEMLLKLQQIDTEIDRIRTIRGELPLEVQDLEDAQRDLLILDMAREALKHLEFFMLKILMHLGSQNLSYKIFQHLYYH